MSAIVLTMAVFVQAGAELITPGIEPSYPPESEEYQLLFGAGCSLGCAIDWSFAATSILPPIGDNTYEPANVSDMDPSTAWVEGAEGCGEGARLLATFEGYGEATGDSINFNGMTIQNGYAKDEATWRANSRVRELGLYLDGELFAVAELADTMNVQRIYWDEIRYIRSGDVFEMEIISVYEGDRYEDTAISEVMFFGGH